MLSALLAHLGEYKATYLIPAIVTGAVFVTGGTNYIDSRVDLRVVSIEAQLDGIQLRILERDMRELKALLCRSPGAPSLLQALAESQRVYQSVSVNRARYVIPTCSELGANA